MGYARRELSGHSRLHSRGLAGCVRVVSLDEGHCRMVVGGLWAHWMQNVGALCKGPETYGSGGGLWDVPQVARSVRVK